MSSSKQAEGAPIGSEPVKVRKKPGPKPRKKDPEAEDQEGVISYKKKRGRPVGWRMATHSKAAIAARVALAAAVRPSHHASSSGTCILRPFFGHLQVLQ